MDKTELAFLKSLSKQFPTIASASTEIINLQAILNLPKGTEHFLSDIHGEYEQFNHVLKNGSGSVRRKIDEEFGNNLSIKDKRSLATLIYYPSEKLELVVKSEDNIEDWYKITLHRLVQMTKRVTSKYTKSKVRKSLPNDFAYIIEELISEKEEIEDKEAYYNEIINTIIEIDRAPNFIIALCKLIQRMVIDHLHIVGDIYDRGEGPHIIMDTLMKYHSVDVQWGNHDILWMGAASGHLACIATVLRVSARYANLDIIEDGYGINLIPLVTFVMDTYKDTDCSLFGIKCSDSYNKKDMNIDIMMHKAMSIIQFKLEGELVMRRPEFGMTDRAILDKIDYENKTVTLYGNTYDMIETDFPTVDPSNPYKLSQAEEDLMERLRKAFTRSEKLQAHVKFLFAKGSMYKAHNGNLLYHGCVPMNDDGSFTKVNIAGKDYSGKDLYEILESYSRKGFYSRDPKERLYGQDVMWYIWGGPSSPVFGKDKMATFERCFIEDKESHREIKNPYYNYTENEEVIDRIMEEFGLCKDTGHIINGHVPVERKKGETPIKCDGKLLIIDGGFSKAYQGKTGIAGYTLVANSRGLRIVAHEHFESAEMAINDESDIFSDAINVVTAPRRVIVADTDAGLEIKESIHHLNLLLKAYREGVIVQKLDN